LKVVALYALGILFQSLVAGDNAFAQGSFSLLKDTEETCKRVHSIEKGDYKERLARKYQVSERSVQLLRARWDFDPSGAGKTCFLIIDTAIGPKRCKSKEFYTNDSGKTVTGVFWSENLCY
jgi:hypothetical protein